MPPVRAELFHVDGQTDTTKLVLTFRNFANSPIKKSKYVVSLNSNLGRETLYLCVLNTAYAMHICILMSSNSLHTPRCALYLGVYHLYYAIEDHTFLLPNLMCSMSVHYIIQKH
jgi:hypothetical protein